MNNSQPEIRVLDADGFAGNVEPALVLLDITRREVEACNICSVMERLYVLTDSPENTRLYRDSLMFQVGGYDHDPRELAEIPEVRAFFAKLTKESITPTNFSLELEGACERRKPRSSS